MTFQQLLLLIFKVGSRNFATSKRSVLRQEWTFFSFFYLLLSQRDLSSMWQGSWIHLWTVSLCCSFLFSWKDIVMFSEVALVSVSCNCLISWIVIVQGYRLWNAANTANAIPLSHFLQKYAWNNWPLSYRCFFKKS